MKSGFYIVDAVAHYVYVNGQRHALCGMSAVTLATPYVQREHIGVVPKCEACMQALKPTVTKAEVPVEACTCYACARSSVSRNAKAEGS